MRVGIVGAGIAGLACAHSLTAGGHDVVLLDKGRGPGGRMSTRRLQTSQGVASFDHGAQYFTARDENFRAQVDDWITEGVVAPWPAAAADAYVGVPAMNAPVKSLAARQLVQWATRVTAIEECGEGWRLRTDAGNVLDVDLAVIAVPAEQAAALLAGTADDLAATAGAAPSEPCWALMASFAEPVVSVADCRRGEEVIGWAARNNAKPGRTGPESWVVQATGDWSRRHIDDDPDEVSAALIDALARDLGVDLPPRIGTAAHLWRFARCEPGGTGPVLDADRRLGLCGDWLIGPRVECAWLSGVRLADRIANSGR